MADNEVKKINLENKTPLPLPEENIKLNNNISDINNNINNDINNINNSITLNKSKTIKFSGKLRLNITIIGKRKCGKSALIKSYLKKSFENVNKDTTLDIFGKKILIYGHEVSLVISEVSQDKSNFQIAKEILSASHIIFICFSLEEDFKKKNEDIMEGSISLLEKVNKNITIFIVGCKFDLIKEDSIDKNKIINEDELTLSGKNVQDYINNKRGTLENNFCGFYITSSLLNLNIGELFNDAIRTVAFPYVKKYEKRLDECEDECDPQKIEINKKKKESINNTIGEMKVDIQIEENGCYIF